MLNNFKNSNNILYKLKDSNKYPWKMHKPKKNIVKNVDSKLEDLVNKDINYKSVINTVEYNVYEKKVKSALMHVCFTKKLDNGEIFFCNATNSKNVTLFTVLFDLIKCVVDSKTKLTKARIISDVIANEIIPSASEEVDLNKGLHKKDKLVNSVCNDMNVKDSKDLQEYMLKNVDIDSENVYGFILPRSDNNQGTKNKFINYLEGLNKISEIDID